MSVPIGILSAAHVHAGGFASQLVDLEGADLVGVADDEWDGRELAERFGVELLERDELLGRVDGVIVCAPNTVRGKWIDAAADAGVDVLCEKPLATTVEEAERLRDRCDEAGVNLGICMPLRFSEPARHGKRSVEAGDIGSLRMATGTNRAKLRNRHETGWSADPAYAGGGAAMDHTVHIVDLVRWMTGEEVVDVHAEHATMHEPLEVEDVNVLSMELSDGTPFTLDGSWDRPEEWDYWGDATLRLVGTEGELSVDCFGQTLKQTRDVGEEPGIQSVYWGSSPNVGMLRDFVAAIREDRSPETTAEDGVREVAVCVAAYESAEQGGPVRVEY